MTYTYDVWSRLDTAQAGPSATPTWKYSYNYDRFGNRRNQNLIADRCASKAFDRTKFREPGADRDLPQNSD